MIIFCNEDDIIVYKSKDLSDGVLDIIKYSKLKSYNVDDVEFCNSEWCNIGKIYKPEVPKNTYIIGDIVFVYFHQQNFKVIEIKEDPFGFVLEEVNPKNPKMPLSLCPNFCNYPKVI